jgi:hypothetical protein
MPTQASPLFMNPIQFHRQLSVKEHASCERYVGPRPKKRELIKSNLRTYATRGEHPTKMTAPARKPAEPWPPFSPELIATQSRQSFPDVEPSPPWSLLRRGAFSAVEPSPPWSLLRRRAFSDVDGEA